MTHDGQAEYEKITSYSEIFLRQARGFSVVDRAELSRARLRRFLAAADEAPPPF